MNLWRNNLRNNGYSEEYIKKCYHEKYENEDIPATLEDHLIWLKDAGFEEIEIFWKKYHFVSFGGFKRL
jgi:tRNA (cmo5U34)-methyltransferase